MTPKLRAQIERMVKPSWEKVGCPRSHGYPFNVYVSPRDLDPMSFAPSSATMSEMTSTYYVARVDQSIYMHEGWRIEKLFAVVLDSDIRVLLRETKT